MHCHPNSFGDFPRSLSRRKETIFLLLVLPLFQPREAPPRFCWKALHWLKAIAVVSRKRSENQCQAEVRPPVICWAIQNWKSMIWINAGPDPWQKTGQGKCHGGNDWEVEVKSGCKESAKRGQAKDEVTLSKGWGHFTFPKVKEASCKTFKYHIGKIIDKELSKA